MANAAGHPSPSVGEQTPDLEAGLLAEPWRYELFQALRLIECAFAKLPRLGDATRAADEPIRLGQRAELAFPPAEIAAWQPVDAESTAPRRLMIRSFGLFGQQGPLPLHLTDYAEARRDREYDPAFQDFCDILHHRLALLHYRAWATAAPAVDSDRPAESRFEGFLAAVAGLAERDDDRERRSMTLHHASYFAGQVRHAEGLRAMLAATFAVTVDIIGFVGQHLTVPAWLQASLGGQSGLGASAILGSRVFERQGRFRLRLGPLGIEDFQRFLPGTPDGARLAQLVRLAVGDHLSWELQLVLRAKEVPAARLGGKSSGQIRLGLLAWMPGGTAKEDVDALVIAAERLDPGCKSG